MNALPQLAAATVNCRVLPEDSPEYVIRHSEKSRCRRSGFRETPGHSERGPVSPLRPDVLEAARRATNALWSGVAVVPDMVMGATDGRAPCRRNSILRHSGYLH